MRPLARLCLVLTALLALAALHGPEVASFPAPVAGGREMSIYSSLDTDLAAPLIAAFQALHPDVAVRYENLLTTELHDRIMAETEAGGPTGGLFAFRPWICRSSLPMTAMRAAVTPDTAEWPAWANWRDTAYALTFEPAVFAYHKPSFAGSAPPATRADLVRWIAEHPDQAQGRVGTYDVARSGVGYLFMARDQELYPASGP